MQTNSNIVNSQKHRNANQNPKLSGRPYYGGQSNISIHVAFVVWPSTVFFTGNNLSTSQIEKADDVKITESVSPNASSGTTKAATTAAINQTPEIAKDGGAKDETSVIKD